MNEIILKTDLVNATDDELATSYILANKVVPKVNDAIVKEMLKRNIGDKLVIINNEPIRVEKQPNERLIDTKENDIKKILIHCIKNEINEVFNNITIKQGWLDEQK
ncbi:MAG: hypothetical protein LBE13_04445 [Bacteroidales bacterium]|jgi:hypothetical protein|nr:hypothetical protein [Bacteroidales bacterium]